jgi:hypothetical protein
MYREDDISPFLYHPWKGRYLVFLQPPDHAGRTQPTAKHHLIHHSVSTYIGQAADALTGMPRKGTLLWNCCILPCVCSAGVNTFVGHSGMGKHFALNQKQKDLIINLLETMISGILNRK